MSHEFCVKPVPVFTHNWELKTQNCRYAGSNENNIPIINTYVPNGYKVGTPQHKYKLNWYARLKSYFAEHLSPDKPAIWCGGMNVAPDPIDVHSPEKPLRHVCFHETVAALYGVDSSAI